MVEVRRQEGTRSGRGYVEKCLQGEALYGDDFDADEVEVWLQDESEAYLQLTRAQKHDYQYGYHALNDQHGYRHLPDKMFRAVLGVGSASGDELAPIVERCAGITIMEPAKGFEVSSIGGVPVKYVRPQMSGVLPFGDGEFDLLACLGVLHHLPNVSRTIREFHRCLESGGYALIREPVISMGDWRYPRKGLTKRERGIPAQLLREMLAATGFEIVRERACMFPVTARLRHVLGQPVYNSKLAVFIDNLFCSVRIWPNRYHPTSLWHKLRPACLFFVVRKPTSQRHSVEGMDQRTQSV